MLSFTIEILNKEIMGLLLRFRYVCDNFVLYILIYVPLARRLWCQVQHPECCVDHILINIEL